jgi:hypothetical protein
MHFEIEHGSTYRGTCRSCGAPIVWATLRSGSKHPFDREPRIIQQQTDLFAATVTDLVEGWSHYATCPDAKQWSGR